MKFISSFNSFLILIKSLSFKFNNVSSTLDLGIYFFKMPDLFNTESIAF